MQVTKLFILLSIFISLASPSASGRIVDCRDNMGSDMVEFHVPAATTLEECATLISTFIISQSKYKNITSLNLKLRSHNVGSDYFEIDGQLDSQNYSGYIYPTLTETTSGTGNEKVCQLQSASSYPFPHHSFELTNDAIRTAVLTAKYTCAPVVYRDGKMVVNGLNPFHEK